MKNNANTTPISDEATASSLSPRLRDAIIVGVAGLATLAVLLATLGSGGIGFPLDDAWIHQTYARNLAQSGQWAFVEGVPSAGSTSPLWTLLIVPGYWLPVVGGYRVWTALLGFAGLAASGLAAARLAELLRGEKLAMGHYVPLLVGLAVILEWHMVWAAGSGMETILFIAVAGWLWWWALAQDLRWKRFAPPTVLHGLVLGVLGGALALTRPEGILVIGLAGLYGLARWKWRSARWALGVALGFGLLVAPYLALNLQLGGTLLPNTALAKQTEYAITRQAPYMLRFAMLWVREGGPLVGAQVLLLPGLVFEVATRLRGRDWRGLLPLGWAAAHVALYAWRLPVSYQHGRYVMPVVPMVVLYGLLGTLRLIRPAHNQVVRRILSLGWLMSAMVLFPLFLGIFGLPAYVRDVRIIDSEMVVTARWIEANIEPDALLAVHDIGALGYFAQPALIDLAGLVSPAVIPIIRDQAALLALMEARQADYLVAFPNWYPDIVSDPRVCPVYSSQGTWAPAAGGENMAVYALNWQAVSCPDSSK